MRRLAVALILIAAPLASAQLSLGDNEVAVEVDHTLLGPDGEPTAELTPGSGAKLEVNLTNNDNRTVNGTFRLGTGEEAQTRAQQTGPVEPNATGIALLPLFVDDDAEAGTRNLTLQGVIQVRDNGNWTHSHNTTNNVTIRVVQPTPEPKFPVVPAALVVLAAGLGGTALYLRTRQQGSRMPPEASEAEKRQARRQRQQSIVDAKRQDIQDSIDRARERMEAGEITEYQFERIKERKEAELEDLDDVAEDTRDDDAAS